MRRRASEPERVLVDPVAQDVLAPGRTAGLLSLQSSGAMNTVAVDVEDLVHAPDVLACAGPVGDVDTVSVPALQSTASPRPSNTVTASLPTPAA